MKKIGVVVAVVVMLVLCTNPVEASQIIKGYTRYGADDPLLSMTNIESCGNQSGWVVMCAPNQGDGWELQAYTDEIQVGIVGGPHFPQNGTFDIIVDGVTIYQIDESTCFHNDRCAPNPELIELVFPVETNYHTIKIQNSGLSQLPINLIAVSVHWPKSVFVPLINN
jgi:hypothetical protein